MIVKWSAVLNNIITIWNDQRNWIWKIGNNKNLKLCKLSRIKWFQKRNPLSCSFSIRVSTEEIKDTPFVPSLCCISVISRRLEEADLFEPLWTSTYGTGAGDQSGGSSILSVIVTSLWWGWEWFLKMDVSLAPIEYCECEWYRWLKMHCEKIADRSIC